jgi:hypothetical protein
MDVALNQLARTIRGLLQLLGRSGASLASESVLLPDTIATAAWDENCCGPSAPAVVQGDVKTGRATPWTGASAELWTGTSEDASVGAAPRTEKSAAAAITILTLRVDVFIETSSSSFAASAGDTKNLGGLVYREATAR